MKRRPYVKQFLSGVLQEELVKWCIARGAALDEKRLRKVVNDLSRLVFVA